MRCFFYVFLIIAITLSASITSAGNAEIIFSDTIDVPDRTITFENEIFDITHIGNFRKGEDISFDVEAESGDELLIILYNSEQLSTWFKRFSNTSGHIELMIPSNRIDQPGTYAVTVSQNRKVIGVMPLVISEYDISLNTDSKTVMAGKNLKVEVNVNRDGIPLSVEDTVKIVLARGSSSIEINATEKNIGVYEANIEIPKPMNGTYSLYSVIATKHVVFNNYPEILGIKSGGNITVVPYSEEQKAPAIGNAIIVLVLLSTTVFMRRK